MKKTILLLLAVIALEYLNGQDLADNQMDGIQIDSSGNKHLETTMGLPDENEKLRPSFRTSVHGDQLQSNINEKETNKDKISSGKASVFPNPAKSYVNLSVPSDLYGGFSLSLCNSSGQLEWIKKIPHDMGLKWTIDIRNLSSGIYYLIIQTPDELIKEKLIVMD